MSLIEPTNDEIEFASLLDGELVQYIATELPGPLLLFTLLFPEDQIATIIIKLENDEYDAVRGAINAMFRPSQDCTEILFATATKFWFGLGKYNLDNGVEMATGSIKFSKNMDIEPTFTIH